jgi:hypothetical protein
MYVMFTLLHFEVPQLLIMVLINVFSFSQLQDVEDDLANFAHMVNTQATAELTYFRGLRDWCQVREVHFSLSALILVT